MNDNRMLSAEQRTAGAKIEPEELAAIAAGLPLRSNVKAGGGTLDCKGLCCTRHGGKCRVTDFAR